MKLLHDMMQKLRLRKSIISYVSFLVRNVRKKKIIFIATPTHGNLGDQAIVLAQYIFLKREFPDLKIFEFTRWQYEYNRFILKYIISHNQIIVIDGGGNIGTLWPEEENKMRDIISRFPDNPIYIFPQTAFFSKDIFGEDELEKTIKIYGAHKNLTIFARDIDSYQLLKENLKHNVIAYTPDIVTYVNNIDNNLNRHDIILCMREDLEKNISDTDIRKVKRYLQDNKLEFKEISTKRKQGVDSSERKKVVIDKWNEFSEVKLVITDRLHGMIFAAITGTPCLALDNISHKVKNGYSWFKNLQYIYLCENVDELISLIKQYYDMNNTPYNNQYLRTYYESMRQEIERNL